MLAGVEGSPTLCGVPIPAGCRRPLCPGCAGGVANAVPDWRKARPGDVPGKGLYTVVKYVRATPFGLAWQAAKGHPLQVGELLFYLLEPEGQGDPLGERPANEEG